MILVKLKSTELKLRLVDLLPRELLYKSSYVMFRIIGTDGLLFSNKNPSSKLFSCECCGISEHRSAFKWLVCSYFPKHHILQIASSSKRVAWRLTVKSDLHGVVVLPSWLLLKKDGTLSLLCPLKTSENLRWVFRRGYRSGTLIENRLIPETYSETSSAKIVSLSRETDGSRESMGGAGHPFVPQSLFNWEISGEVISYWKCIFICTRVEQQTQVPCVL